MSLCICVRSELFLCVFQARRRFGGQAKKKFLLFILLSFFFLLLLMLLSFGSQLSHSVIFLCHTNEWEKYARIKIGDRADKWNERRTTDESKEWAKVVFLFFFSLSHHFIVFAFFFSSLVFLYLSRSPPSTFPFSFSIFSALVSWSRYRHSKPNIFFATATAE